MLSSTSFHSPFGLLSHHHRNRPCPTHHVVGDLPSRLRSDPLPFHDHGRLHAPPPLTS
ncbi:hypothetical protein BDN72DRAFT_842987 [Pluteus cervinus]|uniref:Uncharacterized protein n=1 Tax=Pluteus cervinus TaxID=181527 RepID=A0ACD3ANI1_9AGAR|nr:hypothetical protein BDN72DRAFT_842987 [Pluteus cervinus]